MSTFSIPRFIFGLLTLFLALSITSPASAQTVVVYVDAAATAGGNGSDWVSGTPYKYLQDGIDRANGLLDANPPLADVVQIWVRSKWPGGIGIHTYYPDEDEASGPAPDHATGSAQESFELRNNVELYSGFDGTETSVGQRDTHTKGYAILTGDLDDDDNPSPGDEFINYEENTAHVVIASDVDASARLEGFIVEHGFADNSAEGHSYGGGILLSDRNLNNPGTPMIRDCIVQDNFAFRGGAGIAALDIANGTLVDLRDCIVQRNWCVGTGGGLWADADTSLFGACRLVNITFHDNFSSSSDGAGAYVETRPGEVINCIFTDNFTHEEVGGNGGGLSIRASDGSQVTNSTFSGNRARFGGGMHMFSVYSSDSGTVTINQCSLTENHAAQSGAAQGRGGGISIGFTAGTSPTLEIRNTIVWGNTSEATGSTPITDSQIYKTTSSGTFAVTYSDVEVDSGTYTGAGNINADPLFRSSDNLYLAYTSPCVDAGSNSLLPPDTADLDDNPATTVLPVDLNGSLRVQDGDDDTTDTVDMGAYELAPPSTCAPDINGNCTVNGIDLALLLGAWGPCASCDEDLNGDGVVDGFDLALLLGMWGPCEDCESLLLFGGGEEESEDDEDYPLLLWWLLTGDYASIFAWAAALN